MEFADLHIHSFYSDSTMSPREIYNEAVKNKVGIIAITDHNEIKGSQELMEICNNTTVKCVSGVELDAIQNDYNYHILGYGVDLKDSLFAERVASNKRLLEEVNIRLIKKMQIEYSNVSLEEYSYFNYNRELGGWKALHYFMYKGLVQNLTEGFYFYKKYEHSYTCVDFPDVKTICRWIHDAGGVAILAHPGKVIVTEETDEFKKTFHALIESGLDGAECYYPSHTKDLTLTCLRLCKQKGLIITSGSDCHGSFEETNIGQLCTSIEELNLWRHLKLI